MSTLKVIGQPTGETDLSAEGRLTRLCLPGVSVEMPCPECSSPWRQDLGKEHMGFPEMNTEGGVELYGYCQECEHEWDVRLTLHVRLSVPASEGKS